jgi:hypothetical protein
LACDIDERNRPSINSSDVAERISGSVDIETTSTEMCGAIGAGVNGGGAALSE